MPKITDAGYGDLTSYVATFKLIGHDPTEGSVADQTKRLELQDFVNMLYQLIPRPGMMLNGKLSVTVSANDLIVALKTRAGTDPSATDSVAININGTIRVVTAATSITLADATNWFNAGSAELATKEIDYFAYAVWDSNSSIVALSASRIPYGRLVSDFSSTSTNEKYLGNYANFTSTDDVVNIGRFAATLSAGAGYTWTVPTFTNANLIHEPIFNTRQLSFTTTISYAGGTTDPTSNTVNVVFYQIDGRLLIMVIQSTLVIGAGNRTITTYSMPWGTFTQSLMGGSCVDNITAVGGKNASASYQFTTGGSTLFYVHETMTQNGNYNVSLITPMG